MDKGGPDKVTVATNNLEVEITIRGELDNYTPEDQNRLLLAIGHLLSMEENIHIKKIRHGSIKLTIELPPEKAEELIWAIRSGQLKEYGVVDAVLKASTAAIPVVEEDISIGKREVERGHVRIYSRVKEQPAEEAVRLREEKVTVERRPVDRPATDADFAAAARKVIELTEAAEEPVVNKRARVVEEVVVHKDVTEHNAVQGETAMPLYDKGDVRIHYEEVGAGFPLLVIPGGGLNSTVAGLATHPFNPFDEFKDEFRVIAADLRNAKGSQSTGPLEVGRPWDAYTDDQLGLMDHLGIQEFMVLGFCIGGPFIWNLLQRAGDRVVAAVLAQPSGYRPEMPDLSYTNNMQGWGRSCAPAGPTSRWRWSRPS